MAQPEVPVVDEARAALRAGDAARALRVLAAADEAAGPVLDCQARAMYLQLDFHAAVETWERAYAAYRAANDQLGAVRVARTLGFMHGAVMGDGAVMQGWLARAQILLVGDRRLF